MKIANFKNIEWILVCVFFSAFLLPLWCNYYPVSQDGPAHIHSALVIKQLLTGENPLINERIQLDFSLIPNLANVLIMVPLNYVFSPIISGKIYISLYLVLFPISAAFAVRSFNKNIAPSAILVFVPLMYSYIYHMGFYNYLLGIVSVFFFIGLWERSKNDQTTFYFITIAAASLAVFFCHLVAIISVCIYTSTDIFWEYYLKRDTRILTTRIKKSFFAMLPVAILTIPYMYNYMSWISPSTNSKSLLIILRTVARDIVFAMPRLFISFSIYDYALTIIATVFIVCLIFVVVKKRLLRLYTTQSDIFIIMFSFFVFIYFYVSEAHFLKSRLLLYAVIFLILWIAINLPRLKPQYFIAITAIAIIFISFEFISTHKTNIFYNKMVNVTELIEDGDSFISIRILGDEYHNIKRYHRAEAELHAPSYASIHNNIFDWNNYQFGRTEFILRYIVDTPSKHYHRLEGKTKFSAEELITMLKIIDVDYLLLFSDSNDPISSLITQDEIEKMVGFDLVQSSPDGSIVLYRTPLSHQPKG